MKQRVITYLKLLHYELHRFRGVFGALLAIVALMQTIGVFRYTSRYMDTQGQVPAPSLTNAAAASDKLAPMDFDFMYASFYSYADSSPWFNFSIVFCAAALLFYVLFIWYRDWFGRNQFIYRLLTLPAPRGALYAAKLSAILLLVWGLVAGQLLLLTMEWGVYLSQIPAEYRLHETMVGFLQHHALLAILLPPSVPHFLFSYIGGVLFVMTAFLAILLERSYRWKGAAAGILYAGAAAILLALPTYATEVWYPNTLYPYEKLAVQALAALVLASVTLALSLRLINRKITV